MAETTNNILTRIALKIDTYENWTNISAPGQGGNLVLKRGEIGLCEIPSGNLEATTAPTVLFKVGDGTNIFKDLKWASALAADVYAWAKKSEEEFTAWVAKTPKTVTLTVNGANTDYTIEEAIKLVRNEITAGGEAAAITIADESTTGKIKYTAKQGGTSIVESIEANAGTGINITVQNNVPEIAHQAKPTSGSAASATAGSGRTYVTEVLVDGLGHIAGVKTATESDQTIDWETQVPAHETPIAIVNDTAADVPTTETVDVYKDLTASGTSNHTLTETLVQVATKKAVDNALQAAKDYADAKPHVNTAHTHSTKEKSGIKANGSGDISGDTTFELNVALALKDKTIVLYDKTGSADDSNNILASLDATSFIKDGMIKSVELVQQDGSGNEGQFLKITWNIDDANGTDTDTDLDVVYVNVGDLVDVYTAAKDATEVQIAISNTNEVSATLVNKGVTEEKLEQDVQDALALARTALQSHQDITGKADKVTGATEGNFAGLDENGNLTDSGKKASDFEVAGAAQNLKNELNPIINEKLNANGWVDTAEKNGWHGSTGAETGVEHFMSIDPSAISTYSEYDGTIITSTDVTVSNDDSTNPSYTRVSSGAVKISYKANSSYQDNYATLTESNLTFKSPEEYCSETTYSATSISYNFPTSGEGYAAEGTLYFPDIQKADTIAVRGDLTIYGLKEGSCTNAGDDSATYPKYLIFDCGSATEVI